MIKTRGANIKDARLAYKYNYRLLEKAIEGFETRNGSVEAIHSSVNRLWQLDFEIYFHPILELEDKIKIYEWTD